MESSKPRDPVLKQLHLKIATNAAFAEQILAWFEELNQPPLPSPMIWWHCQTAFKEAFDNVIEHAHKGLAPDTPIEIQVLRFAEKIEIRLWDFGQFIDLQQVLARLPELEENRHDHGRGLRIMAKVMDDWSYTRTADHRNCLLLVKQFTSQAREAG